MNSKNARHRHETDILSGHAVPDHHRHRMETEERNTGEGEGSECNGVKRQTVTDKNENALRKKKEEEVNKQKMEYINKGKNEHKRN
jgi:hypothetical protein